MNKLKKFFKAVFMELNKILYVEDDKISQQILKYYLKNKYILDLADDGFKALDLVKQVRYDLILMDINLGSSMTGLQTAQIIKKMPLYKDTPIVAVTAYTRRKEVQNFLNNGCTHYLSKPYIRKDILNIISDALISAGSNNG